MTSLIRLTTRVLLLAVAVVAIASPAPAQQCGSSVSITYGESLRDIAERCGLTVEAILQANPSIRDSSEVAVGTVLDLPVEGRRTPSDRSRGEIYVVQAGDFLSGIAQRFGTTLSRLLDLNPEITDPNVIEIGQRIEIPAGDDRGRPVDRPIPGWNRAAAIEISPVAGEPGSTVRIIGERFPANHPVEIGAGPPHSEFDVIERTRSDRLGRIDVRVPVPPEASDDEQYVFVATTPNNRVKATSTRFNIVDAGRGPRREEDRIEVTGVVTGEGVECPQIRADDGTRYTLAMGDRNLNEGDRIRVEGTIAEVSTCMQGTTIAVERVAYVDAPGGGEQIEVTGVVTGEGVECPQILANDGRLYTLAGTDLDELDEGDRVHVHGTVAEMSICMQGMTISVDDIDHVDERGRAVERTSDR